jgi:hypothetical protein
VSSGGVSAPPTTTIASGQTASPPVPLTAQIGGSATVTASASGFQNGSLTVNVHPVITSLSPTSGAPHTVVTINGAGFANGATLNFGNQNLSTTFVSSSQLTATVPIIAAGRQSLTLTINGQTSRGASFLVLGATPSHIVFRSSDTEVQSFDFSNPAQPTPIDHQSATPATAAAPSLGLNGGGNLLRTTSADIQVFTVTPDGHMAQLAQLSAQPSPTGTAAAANGGTMFRGIDIGLQSFRLSGTSLTLLNSIAGTVSAYGIGLDVAGNIAVRAHSAGIDVFDVSNPTNMRLVGTSNTGLPSMTGVDLKIFAGGTRAVRAHSTGIEIYNISQPAAPVLIGANNSGVPSAVGVAVAVSASGTIAVRAHPTGIEIYDLTAATFPQLGTASSAGSPTGVAVAICDSTAFLGLASGIEAFSIANPSNPSRLGDINATPAVTGVASTCR